MGRHDRVGSGPDGDPTLMGGWILSDFIDLQNET